MNTENHESVFQLSKNDLDEFSKMSQLYRAIGFFGIMVGFIVCLLSSLSFIASLVGVTAMQGNGYLSSIPYFMFALIIIISAVFFIASLKLNRLGYNLQHAIDDENQDAFDEAIEVLQKYFESYGQIMIVFSIVFVIIIIKSLNVPTDDYNNSF